MRRRFILYLLITLALVVVWRVWSGGPTLVVEDGSTLHLKVHGRYIEAPAPGLLSRFMGDAGQPFASLLSTLALAERDDRLDAVILHIRALDVGWGKADELRGAIGRLRKAGRKTIAYLELESLDVNRVYYIASAADEIYVVPGSTLPLVGLGAEYFYLGGLWEKIDLEIESTKVGRYKSAVETLTGKEMSEASREMANSLLDVTEARFIRAIAEGRGMLESEIRAIIEEGPVLAQQLLRRKLIDGILHFDEILEARAHVVDGDEYATIDPATVGFDPQTTLALIYGSGTVISGEATRSIGGAPVFSSERARDALLDAARDPKVSGIILRIDSPGGSALAAEVIWNAVRMARGYGKPVVASFSDVAASAAYYIASAADAIVAPAGVLTGSIGVFSLRPVLGGVLQRLGIRVESLRRGPHADFHSLTQPLSDGSRERMQALTLEIYDLFVQRVAEGRSLDAAQVDAAGQGRVWTGEQALAERLIDEIGGLHVAVDRMLEILGRDPGTDVILTPFPTPPTLAVEIADLLQGRAASAGMLRSWLLGAGRSSAPLAASLRTLEAFVELLPLGSPLLIPPMLIDIR